MKKKQVSLDVFEDAVLAKLQTEHADIADLQKAINDNYSIYEEDGEGNRTVVKYTVSGPKTKAKPAAEVEAEMEDKIQAAVAKALEPFTKANAAKKVGEVDGGGDAEAQTIKIPAEVKRHGVIKNFAAVKRHGLDADERCYAFGMWALAAMGNPLGKAWCDDHGIKLHQENINSAGGFTVPEILSTDFIELKESYGTARRLFGRYPMSSDTLMINRRVSGLSASFVAEGAAASESTMSIDQVRLTAKDLMAITRITGQLNADSLLPWSDRLAYEIAYQFTLKEDQCAWLGDGSSTYGGITGIKTAFTNKWTPGAPGTGVGLIKQGTSTTWAAIVLSDFDAVVGALPQYADTPNCVWAMHRTFYYTVVEKLIQAQGGVPAYETRQGQRAPRPLFKGYPVEFVQVLPSTSTSAQVNCTLGDHSLAAAFGDRQQDSIDFNAYATVGGQSMWERNQIGVRGIERFDINVHDIGDGSAVAGPIVAFANG